MRFLKFKIKILALLKVNKKEIQKQAFKRQLLKTKKLTLPFPAVYATSVC